MTWRALLHAIHRWAGSIRAAVIAGGRRRRRHPRHPLQKSELSQQSEVLPVFQSTQRQLDAFPPSLTFRLFLELRRRVLRLLGRHVALVVDGSVPPVEDGRNGPLHRVNRGYRTRSSPNLPMRPARRRRDADHSPCPSTSPPASLTRCSICGVVSTTSTFCPGMFSSESDAAHVRLVVADLERDNLHRPEE